MNQLELRNFSLLGLLLVLGGCASEPVAPGAGHDENVAATGSQLSFGLPKPFKGLRRDKVNVQLGPRPYYLVDDMDEGPL